jgi:hypothetical protein
MADKITFAIPRQATPTKCRACKASIVFVQHPKTGRSMPIEFEGEHRGESHFAYCLQADLFRRPR